jgi:hypothetical protein
MGYVVCSEIHCCKDTDSDGLLRYVFYQKEVVNEVGEEFSCRINEFFLLLCFQQVEGV